MTDETTVRAEVKVEAPIERAFAVFTEGFGRWWPADYHISTVEMAGVTLEGREGGRWFERGVDGSECDWGTVLVWDPPRHLALRWDITPTWQHEPDPAKASRVDIRFAAEGPGTTRVELVHSGLDRHGEGWEALRAAVGDTTMGWSPIMDTFAALAAKAEEGGEA